MFILPKGTICHTISSDPSYTIAGTHYISFLPNDISVYRLKFPWEVREREGDTPIYDFYSTPKRDLKILEYEEAKRIFDRLYDKNEPFRLQVGMIIAMFLDSFQYLDRSLNGRELLIYELFSNVRYGDRARVYDAFEVSFEMDIWLFLYPYVTFFKALRRKGYDGLVDTADIRYNTYDVRCPVVVINPDRMELLGSQRL